MRVDDAVAALARGEVVGMPTDTVYGLAADPLQRSAVERLFELKGRPPDRPIALLVSGIEQVARLAETPVPPRGARLAERCWPGPLTLVVRRRPDLPEWVGDPGRATVGVRAPDHPVALELLEASGPLAVTSANLSGRPPATSDRQAEGLFGDRVAGYLPGRCPGGEASTVLDLTVDPPEILRPGPLDAEVLRRG